MPSFRGRISIQHGLIQPKAYNDHRKVIDGFQVQIDRLEAKEGVLFAAVTSATDTSLSLNNIAQVAAIKEQKAKLETGKTWEEEREFASYLLKGQLPALQNSGARVNARQHSVEAHTAEREGARFLDSTIEERDTDVSFISKRSHSSTGNNSLGGTYNSHDASGAHDRLLAHSTTHHLSGMTQPFGGNASSTLNANRQGEEPQARNSRIRSVIIAETHPTVVSMPYGGGAVELRCCCCNSNTTSGRRFFYGVQGMLHHLRFAHPNERKHGKSWTTDDVLTLCVYKHVPQDIVDALQRGEAHAYYVRKIRNSDYSQE